MIEFKAEVTINVAPEKVFAVLTAVEKYSRWTDMKESKAISSGGLVRVGAQMETIMGAGPLKQKIVFEVAAFEPNRRMAVKTVSKGSFRMDGDYTLEPQGASTTRVLLSGQVRLFGIARLLEPLMAGEVRKGEQKELDKLKELLESNKI
jgi:uncharacterized protein YndB with AHSA1/START domain